MSCSFTKFVAQTPRIIGALIEIETATSTRPIIPADVTTIRYTVTTDDGATPIVSGTLTPIASYIFDPPREGDRTKFKTMETWNFEHKAPATFFPATAIGKNVRIVYELEDALGTNLLAPFCIERYVTECVECPTSC